MRIEFRHICKSFGKVEVLKDISLVVEGGQIMALLGENGAGKSTLMNILGGLFPPDGGELLLDGKLADFQRPMDSIRAGIAFIHQELSPVNDLRVYENIFLGRELANTFGLLRRRAMAREARSLLDALGIGIDEQCYMRELDASHKQIVEICRALQCRARIVIMDEPTTSLAEQEISLLFDVVRRLASQGVGVIFISHKLNEVKELCTHYAVLRNGGLVGGGLMGDVSPQALSELIVGHELANMRRSEPAEYGDVVLRLEHLGLEHAYRDVNFELKAGEILGITGLLGDGRSELCRSIFGDLPGFSGNLFYLGRKFAPSNPGDAIAQGIAYVPSNRKENGIVPDLSVLENGTLATLRKYCRFAVIDRRRQREAFCARGSDFNIKYASDDDYITTLSGGNQQKVVLARWLEAAPRLLMLDNPTQGVDIGAKQEIYEIIRKIAAGGVAVIVLSGEGQEIMRLCQRTLVMFHGAVQGELAGEAMTETAIMKLATGLEKC